MNSSILVWDKKLFFNCAISFDKKTLFVSEKNLDRWFFSHIENSDPVDASESFFARVDRLEKKCSMFTTNERLAFLSKHLREITPVFSSESSSVDFSLVEQVKVYLVLAESLD